MKPIHAKTISKVYERLKSVKANKSVNGFRAAGITEAVKKIRENPKSGLILIESIIQLISLCRKKKMLFC